MSRDDPSSSSFEIVKSSSIEQKPTSADDEKARLGKCTTLHLAVALDRSNIVEGLVNCKHVTPQYLGRGKTTFSLAAAIGKLQYIKNMMEKNPDLPLIPGQSGKLPIHLAAKSKDLEIVKKRVPHKLSTLINKEGKTPDDTFYVDHKKLSNEVKNTAKTVANSGTVVAALVVTVAFVAALTTLGGKTTNAWFVMFTLTNAAALFTSVLSIVAFLSIFTSSAFQDSDFVTSLYLSLILGKMLLYISIVSMIIAFVATSFLIFGHEYRWVAYLVTLFRLLTIFMILHLQHDLFSRYIKPCVAAIRNLAEPILPDLLSDEDAKILAYNEAGHALVARHTVGSHSINFATIVPSGKTLGFVAYDCFQSRLGQTREQYLAFIDIAIGGKAAEEVMFGADKITVGAIGDLRMATREARAFVSI